MHEGRPLSPGTEVDFDIAQGLAVGKGVIRAAEFDDGWLCRIDVGEGNAADAHRNEMGELWVCEFEVRAMGQAPASHRH